MNTTTNTRGVEIPGLIEMSDLLRKRGVETRSYRDHEIAEAAFRAALEAALSAPEPPAQGEAVAWDVVDEDGCVVAGRVDRSYADQVVRERWQDKLAVLPLYRHAERARVPDAMSTDGLNIMSSEFDRREGWNACREAMLAAAAPCPPKDAGEVES